jgi:DNA-binding transcriptional LysR family regulator
MRDIELAELRLGDLWTFLAVQRTASITAAARELKVTPSQVSKTIARLERQLEIKLLSRSGRGVSLTDDGRRIAPQLEELATRVQALRRSDTEREIELTVAAPSYLIATCLPVIASAYKRLRVRGLEIPPALVRAYAAENFFDMTLVGATDQLPPSWETEPVGHVRKALFAPPKLAKQLGRPARVSTIRALPFVGPIYNAGGRFVPVDDDCPLPARERIFGHQAQTIALGLELAARSEQLVFGPVIAARRFVDAGALREVQVDGWDVADPLYLGFNTTRVLARVRTAVVQAVKKQLAALDP